MKKSDLAKLLFEIQEQLIEVDQHRRQISDCKKCQGLDVEELKDMCPSCLEALREHTNALKKLSEDPEIKKNLNILKEVLENDKTGEMAKVLEWARGRS